MKTFLSIVFSVTLIFGFVQLSSNYAGKAGFNNALAQDLIDDGRPMNALAGPCMWRALPDLPEQGNCEGICPSGWHCSRDQRLCPENCLEDDDPPPPENCSVINGICSGLGCPSGQGCRFDENGDCGCNATCGGTAPNCGGGCSDINLVCREYTLGGSSSACGCKPPLAPIPPKPELTPDP